MNFDHKKFLNKSIYILFSTPFQLPSTTETDTINGYSRSCVYNVEYIRGSDSEHTEFKDRKYFLLLDGVYIAKYNINTHVMYGAPNCKMNEQNEMD